MGNTCCPKGNGENKADDEKKALLTSKKATTCYMSPACSLNHEGKATSKHEPANYDILNSVFISLCEEIGKDWMMLGRILFIKDAELDEIDNKKVSLIEKAYRMLCLWKKHHKSPTLDVLLKELEKAGRHDLINIVKEKSPKSPDINSNLIVGIFPNGCAFKLDLLTENEQLTKVEYKLKETKFQWEVKLKEKNKPKPDSYYITKQKEKGLFVKVENFKDYGTVEFQFSFEDSKAKSQRSNCFEVLINEWCSYEISCNQLSIIIPDPCFSKKFHWIDQNPPMPDYLDWRVKINHESEISKEKPIREFAMDYFDRNFVDLNQVICFPPLIDEEINITCIPRLFTKLFKEKVTEGIRAVLYDYDLYHHATLLNFKPQEHIKRSSANRVVIFYSKINLILIVRAASSSDCINQECKNCSADVKYFASINKLVIEEKPLTILGVVACCSVERKDLEQELSFQYSSKFPLYNVLFICRDELDKYETFCSWWRREFYKYCLDKNSQTKDEALFKQLIGLTMLIIAKCNEVNLPTLKSDTLKQIKSLILNPEQVNAINDKELKKIIYGGFGSGKSLVGREIVKNFYLKSSKKATMFYICCDYFSLLQCEMKEFTDSLKKESNSNVEILCENLLELWQRMGKNQKFYENKDISLPKLLKYYCKNSSTEVHFVLDELPGEYVREEDTNKFKKLFSSFLKDSLVVFILKSVGKNLYLNRDGEIQILDNTCFNKEKVGMKNIALKKSMRVTKRIQFLIDSAQDTLSKLNTISFKNSNVETTHDKDHNSFSNMVTVSNEQITETKTEISNFNTSQIITQQEGYHDYDLDEEVKVLPNNEKFAGSNSYIETHYVFDHGVSGHSIEGEKPIIIFLPSLVWTNENSAKVLSVVLEKICFDKVRATTVICSNMDEVKVASYAIDIIENYESVIYSPYLQKYNPTIEKMISVTNQFKESQLNVLVADSRAMCGVETEVVIVLVKPEEYYFRHAIAEICARCYSNLIVLVLPSENAVFKKGGTIQEVFDNWSEDVVEKIQVKISNDQNQLWSCKDCNRYINDKCKEFKDRGARKNFIEYIENDRFKINDENGILC